MKLKTRDKAVTLTTSFQALSALADTDHNDFSNLLQNVTISNQTNVTIYVKNCPSAPSGTGRAIIAGDSFNYLAIKATECFMKAASTPTGSVIITANHE